MTEFRWNGDRLDVYFAGDDAHQVAFTIIALCAYPLKQDLVEGGAAHKLFDAIAALAYRQTLSARKRSRLPPGIPSVREMNSRLDKGDRRLARFRALNVAISLNQVGKGPTGIKISGAPDLTRFTVTMSFDARGKLQAQDGGQPRPIAKLLEFHQPLIERGGADPYEDARTLSKRYVRPLLRIAHILGPLHGYILSQEGQTHSSTIDSLIYDDPVWAWSIVDKSNNWEKVTPSLMRQAGFRSASASKMIYLHR